MLIVDGDFVFNVLVRQNTIRSLVSISRVLKPKFTIVVTASVALRSIYFHKGKDWSQAWDSTGPAPLNCPQAPSLSTEPRSARLIPERNTHWKQFPRMYITGSQRATRPQASPAPHQADPPWWDKSLTSGRWKQPMRAKPFPKYSQCDFALAATYLQSDRQTKGRGLARTSLRSTNCITYKDFSLILVSLGPSKSALLFSPFILEVYVLLSKTNLWSLSNCSFLCQWI